jgi:hypothetical protein
MELKQEVPGRTYFPLHIEQFIRHGLCTKHCIQQFFNFCMCIRCRSSRGQPTRGGPPAWGLGVGLTTPHRKKSPCYET